VRQEKFSLSYLNRASQNQEPPEPPKDSRPLQLHEMKPTTFEETYNFDRRTLLERFDAAWAVLSKNPQHVNPAVRNSFAPVRQRLVANHQANDQALRNKEQQLRQEVQENNERILAERQRVADRVARLNQEKAHITEAFEREKVFSRTYHIITQHNERQAIDLFRELYRAQRRSILGSMHAQLNGIVGFSTILDYGNRNKDFFESKTRGILRQHLPLLDAIRFYPFFLKAQVSQDGVITLDPLCTFSNQEEAQAYAQWYEEKCPKKPSDAQLLVDFKTAYEKYVKDTFWINPFDKMKHWLAQEEIYACGQLVAYAQAEPASKTAELLNTEPFKTAIARLQEQDRQVAICEITSPFFTEVKQEHWSKYYNNLQPRLGVDMLYDFSHSNKLSYSGASLDNVRHFSLVADPRTLSHEQEDRVEKGFYDRRGPIRKN
jgi:hypothetical protein